MLKRFFILCACIIPVCANAELQVKTVSFLKEPGVAINAAGPLLFQMDTDRNRLVVANTLSSSVSVIDCRTKAVTNIPVAGRALQHLKSEAMTIRKKTGDIYLIGTKCIHIVYPEAGTSYTVRTDVQFESIAVDEATGNAFVAGREHKKLGLLRRRSSRLKMLSWTGYREDLINLNQTPPPPVRKVVADAEHGWIIAVDGFTSTIHRFDAKSGKPIDSRPVPLASGGRWHLAGYNEVDHYLYLVIETDKREVIEAAKIYVAGEDDVVVPLPKYREGVGIIYNPDRDEVYIPYDNHPSVHVVEFHGGGNLDEIKIPAYGNDASVIDFERDILYVASWAFGEIEVIDLKERKLLKRITGTGIIPHMFTMTFSSHRNRIIFPKGATAVNGTFGAAITVLDPETERTDKIRTGWAPIDLIEVESRGSFFVFSSEDQFAEVKPDGSYELYHLPYDYPVRAITGPEGEIYLSYGPHQSYWPTVYIWDAKNGVLGINADDLSFYDRRIPRQAHKLTLDRDGVCYFTQNNWGREEQFIGTLIDQVRVYEAGQRLRLGDEVEREITQRILEYDADLDRLYLVKLGELDEDPSLLQIVDLEEKKIIERVELGLTATDLLFDENRLYVANFDSDNISIIDRATFETTVVETGSKPLKLCRCGDRVYVINHLGNTIQEITGQGNTYKIPRTCLPDNILEWNGSTVIIAHNEEELFIYRFDIETETFELLCREKYPYGETRFDTGNVSFYVRGQFGDALFEITRGKVDRSGRLWITDFLSGKLFILEDR